MFRKLLNYLRTVTYQSRFGESYLPPIAHSGEPVTQDTALTMSTVFRCTNLISSLLASLPIRVVKVDSDGKTVDVPDHPVTWSLNHMSDQLPSFYLRQVMVAKELLGGNSFSTIIRNSRGQACDFKLHQNGESCLPMRDPTTGEWYYRFTGLYPTRSSILELSDVLHFRNFSENGIEGRSVIRYARDSLGTSMALERQASSMFAKGRPSGFLSTPPGAGKVNPDDVRKEWARVHAGPDNNGNIGVLQQGATWVNVGMSAEDAQLLESRSFSIYEIARWFGVPPYLLGVQDKSTDIENVIINFIRFTLMPLGSGHCSIINSYCFTPQEVMRRRYRAFYDFDAINRGNMLSWITCVATQIHNGVLTINEARESLNRPAVEGGDTPLIMSSQFSPLGSQPSDPSRTANPTDPNPSNPTKPKITEPSK